MKNVILLLSLFLAVDARAQSAAPSAANAPAQRVETLVAQANARVAAGESPAVVEQELTAQLSAQGAEVEVEPPAWDAFGQARWKRMDRAFAHSLASAPQQTEAAPDETTVVLRTESVPSGSDDLLRGGADGNADEFGSAPVVHFSDAGGVDVEGASNVEARVLHPGRPQPTQGDPLLPES